MLLEDPEFESAYGGTESRRHISLKASKRLMTGRNTVNSKEYITCVADLRSKLVHDGVATLPHFLQPQAIAEAVQDIQKVEWQAWETNTSHNIYLDQGDDRQTLRIGPRRLYARHENARAKGGVG